jgi:hypothetical protein
MRRQLAPALLAFALFGSSVRAQDAIAPAGGTELPTLIPEFGKLPGPVYVPYVPPLAVPGVDPSLLSPQPAPASPFAQPIEAGGQASRTFNENFDGDMSPIYYKQNITTFSTISKVVGFSQQITGFTQQVTIGANGTPTVTNVPIFSRVPVTAQVPVATQHTVEVPLAGRYNGVSVVDWNSPTPRDQVFLGYNFYSNVGASLNPGLGGSDLYRQMGGFEKVLGTNGSIGIRLPFVQQYGPLGLSSQQVGDLTVILKYAAYYNRETGNVLTGGLAITAPTGGGSAILADGTTAPHSWLLQPWGGFVYNVNNRGYVQGISNIITPTDSRDPTLWGNSLGVGYWLYRATSRSNLLTSITPIAEVHVRTPLNHRDPNGDVFFMDQVNVTTGAHFRFHRAIFSSAVVVPLVGPKPFNIEAIGYMSYWF